MQPDRPGRMLVVDDDPRSRKLLEGFLSAEGYSIRSAEDGPTALELARDDPPDVVLLDVMMPLMTGYEVCSILKKDPRTRLCQVMLVTALDSTPDKVEGLDTGADDHVPKPVRRDEFLAKVRALLRAHRLIEELEEARQQLAVRNNELQLKRTLAQSLVHDLKSPLSAILGNLDLLEMRSDEELRYLVLRSKQGAKRMLKLILNLLDVERLEEGRLEPAIDAVDLTALVRATVDESDVSARQKEIDLRFETHEPIRADVDPVLMRRVVDNLVSNAISYAPMGGVVDVAVSRRDEGIELTVSDNGPGVPEELREKVFEKYAQVETRRSGIEANRGLGLTFSRLAVEAQGGTIWIESSPSGGACFRTLVPASVDAPHPKVVEESLLRR